MTNRDLFREIGLIDEKYIVEGEKTRRSLTANPVWRRSLATAACLFLCTGLYFGIQQLNFEKTGSADMVREMPNETAKQYSVEERDETEIIEMYETLAETENAAGSFESAGVNKDTLEEAAKEQLNQQLQTESMSMVSDEENRRDLTEICIRFSKYPETSKELAQAGLVVNVHGVIKSGKEKLDAFLLNAQEGAAASVEFVQFTTEGEPVFYYIHYNGTDFYAVTDSSRDSFAAGIDTVKEYYYAYLKNFSENGKVTLILTDTEDLTPDTADDKSLCIMSYSE